ncbi:hypothetical protein CLV48_101119 [Cecembia rubra]|uniref:Uncharacterized protein n=1 Tax=Cecembia rubra TaxID=1485585 RepID=A0A2P8ECL1_9BACT|nr:hypothetical protein CLV48_101119 [Cecembia rubra]
MEFQISPILFNKFNLVFLCQIFVLETKSGEVFSNLLLLV